MAHYLVSGGPKEGRLEELERRLREHAFADLRPFGASLTRSLRNARRRPDGRAVWEEEDYCSPPLAQEREAVIDEYFDELRIEPVSPGEGWAKIEDLPALFPDLAHGNR